MKWILLLLLILLVLPFTLAQEGRGILIEANTNGSVRDGLIVAQMNPLNCQASSCPRLANWLFPTLIGIDSQNQVYAPSGNEDFILAERWEFSEDNQQVTLFLRDDFTWNDGTPITAYDVFYTFLVKSGSRADFGVILGAVPMDSQTITFFVEENDCAVLNALDFAIVPAHSFDTNFVDSMQGVFDANGDLLTQYETWREEQDRFTYVFDPDQAVTAGLFALESISIGDFIRLNRAEGQQGFEYRDITGGLNEVERFLAGELDYIDNVPLNYWDEFQARDDIMVYEYPGNTWDFISLNFADPTEPESAFDDEGELIEQGHHPIFADIQVRRAMQMAIDVETIINTAYDGHATPMASSQLPTSWAFSETLEPIAYNPDMARQILHDAGWRDVDGDGIRNCRGCSTTDENVSLSFNLIIDDNSQRTEIVGELIRQQLERVGIRLSFQSTAGSYRSQNHDAVLGNRIESYPVNPDQSNLFTRGEDIIGEGGNYGSYYNEELEALLQQARTVPGCDVNQRAPIYHDIQEILQADQPYIWLFARNEMVAVRNNVLNFDPRPNAPFWNIEDWVILR